MDCFFSPPHPQLCSLILISQRLTTWSEKLSKMIIVAEVDNIAKNVMYTGWDSRQYVAFLLFSGLREPLDSAFEQCKMTCVTYRGQQI